MASSLETNKVLAAILTAGVIASGAGVLSRIIYHPEIPEESAYPIETAAGGEAEAGSDQGEVAEESLATLLASADVDAGAKVSKKCSACHSFEEGAGAKIGPPLYGVLGREVASVDGFAYSDALASLGGTWGYEELAAFLTNPKAYAPGTKMTFAGLRKPQDRADVILYIRDQGSQSVPLPEDG